jgi:DNA-binding transcriptional LysR family regulator
LDLNKLHTFLRVADRSSVTAAARELGRTRSAVSQSVGALEQSLGVRLFHRVGRRLILTTAGERLRDGVRASENQLRGALEEVLDVGGEVRGVVRIGVFLGFPRLRLADLVARFAKEHRQVSLRIVFAPEADLNRRLLRGRLDLTVSFRPPGEAMSRLHSIELFEEELVLVSGHKYLDAGFDPGALMQTPVVDYYQSDPLIGRWLRHHCPDRQPEVRVAVWAATTDLVVELIVNHVGVGVVPRYLVEPLVKRKRLRILGTTHSALTDTIWLNELHDPYRDSAQRRFRAAVLEEFGAR